MRLDSNIEQKSPNNTYLNNIKKFIKLFSSLNWLITIDINNMILRINLKNEEKYKVCFH